MKPKKILVTGGAGFIGAAIARKLLQQGFEVDIIDNISTGLEVNIPEEATFFKVDLTAPEALSAFDFGDYQSVFHLAAQPSGPDSFKKPTYDMQANALMTARLLEASHAAGVGHFLYASSMAIYGNQDSEVLSENDPLVPNSFYGANKMVSERYCHIYQSLGLNTTCLRMFSVYGPGQNMQNLSQGMASIFLAYLLKGEKILIKGSLDRFRDFTYMDDVADAWILAHQNEKAYGDIFNIGTGRKTTVRDLISTLVKVVHGRDLRGDDYTRGEDTPGDIIGFVADSQKIEKTLGFKCKTSLETGMQAMIEWAKSVSAF